MPCGHQVIRRDESRRANVLEDHLRFAGGDRDHAQLAVLVVVALEREENDPPARQRVWKAVLRITGSRVEGGERPGRAAVGRHLPERRRTVWRVDNDVGVGPGDAPWIGRVSQHDRWTASKRHAFQLAGLKQNNMCAVWRKDRITRIACARQDAFPCGVELTMHETPSVCRDHRVHELRAVIGNRDRRPCLEGIEIQRPTELQVDVER